MSDPRYQCLGLGPGWSWRLLGSNHRALARAAGTFPTLDDAADDALQVGGRARVAAIEIVAARGTGWRWELTLDDAVRATSAVPYARRLECVRAVARFRDFAPHAAVAAVPLLRRSGSGHGWRTPAVPAGPVAAAGPVEPGADLSDVNRVAGAEWPDDVDRRADQGSPSAG